MAALVAAAYGGFLTVRQPVSGFEDLCGRPVPGLPEFDCHGPANVPDMLPQFGEGVFFAADGEHLLVYGEIAQVEDGQSAAVHLKVAALSLTSGEMVNRHRLDVPGRATPSSLRFQESRTRNAVALLCPRDEPACFADGTHGRVIAADPTLQADLVETHLAEDGIGFFDGRPARLWEAEDVFDDDGRVFLARDNRDYLLQVTEGGAARGVDLSSVFGDLCTQVLIPAAPTDSLFHATSLKVDPQGTHVAAAVTCYPPEGTRLTARLVVLRLDTGEVVAAVDGLTPAVNPALGWSADGQRLAVLVQDWTNRSGHAVVLALPGAQ